ncbi:MAG TPA: ABC-type transport auxiliary lipoprotein family protein [Caulobacteraceae bacterium]|nr:ABC-type transport auxiliary lipoprotein family protein [Caulobacteraceae bacterium]
MTASNRAILTLGAALALGGCISLFPKTPPAQLYRFGGDEAVASATAGSPRGFNVQRLPTGFERAADSDRILTVDGDSVAYIAGARWAAPAAILFDQAETAAFERSAGPARLLRTADSAAAPISLRLDVQTFEARYLAGPKAAPTVVVSVHALLINALTRKVMADQLFEGQAAASENRVGAIVQAYDAATADVLGRIVEWTGREGAAG